MTAADATNCAACGYDLSGLGRQGRCPECGRSFDRLTGDGLRGAGESPAARHQRGDRLVRRLRTIGLALLAVTIMVCAGSLVLVTEQWPYVVATAALVTAVVALGAVTSFLDERENR